MGGDSGGPSFVHFDTSAGTKTFLAGVHSFCMNATRLEGYENTSGWDWVVKTTCGDQSVELIVDRIHAEMARVESEFGPQNQSGQFGTATGEWPFEVYSRSSDGRVALHAFDWSVDGGMLAATGRLQRKPQEVGPPQAVSGDWGDVVDVTAAAAKISNTADGWTESRIFFARESDGALRWRRHDRTITKTSITDKWTEPKAVGAGFNRMRQIFSMGAGTLYEIYADGTLRWQQLKTWTSGDGAMLCRSSSPSFNPSDPAISAAVAACPTPVNNNWSKSERVGNGWQGFKAVFPMTDGILYAVQPNGDLIWYRHNGFLDGTRRWDAPQRVGNGWQNFKSLVGVGDGQILALNPNGDLLWYRHKNWQSMRSGVAAEWEGPVKIASGWTDITHLFAAPVSYAGPN